MIVVASTTQINSLACIGRLDLLERLFGKILVAEAVDQEIKAERGYGYDKIDQPWTEVRSIQGEIQPARHSTRHRQSRTL